MDRKIVQHIYLCNLLLCYMYFQLKTTKREENMKNYCILLLLTAVLAAGSTGCRKKAVKVQKEKVVRVGVMTPVQKLFQQRIPVQGTVAPVRYATLSSKTSGSLDILEAAEGKLMKENDLPLGDWLNDVVFADISVSTLAPNPKGVEEFSEYITRYKPGLAAQKKAGE